VSESRVQDDVALESLVGRVADEFLRRQEQGEQPDLEEYAARYPDAAPVLRKVLASLALLERSLAGGTASTDLTAEEARTGVLGDYRLLREVGRGGMGVVYEAEQISLGRRVALKVLPFAGALDARQLQRFRTEAQAAAHLHHTNIVPVYAVGCERGVHFYAMQFIDGDTVAALIGELRRLAGLERPLPPGGSSPAPPASEPSSTAVSALLTEGSKRSRDFFRTVASLGLQAAEALEHAHTEGIVHRDIKPANLLVNLRGNLWITDFGLARFRNEAGLTVTGDLLGTFRYMSPEQALGRRGVVDQRTDIYSLGATLYELLTLEPVHDGRDRQELLRQIADESPRPPRRLNPAIPADLETVVLKALDKEPEGRYATAQELADDLRHFLEDEPIRARRPTLLQRVGKWARRHRPVLAAGVAVLLLGMAGLAVGVVLIVRQRDEARAQRLLAQQQRERARRAVDVMYTEVAEKWLANQPHLQELQRRFLLEALQYYEEFAAEQDADPAVRHQAGVASRRVGDIQFRLGKPAEAEAAYARAISIQAELAARFPAVTEYRYELAASQTNRGALLLEIGRSAEAEQALRRALPVQEQLASDSPTEPHHRRSLAGTWNNLGMVLAATRRPQEAEHAFHQAAGLLEELTAETPANPKYRQELANSANNLGLLLAARGRPQEAEQSYRRALALREKLLEEFPTVPRYRRDLASTKNDLAGLFQSRGRPREAEQAWREALPLLERLVAEFPVATDYRLRLAGTRNNLAILLRECGRYAEAEQAYRQALADQERLAAESPGMSRFRHELAVCQGNLGNLLAKTGRTGEAVRAYRQAGALLERLAVELPGVTDYGMQLAHSHINLALQLEESNQPREAESAFRQAVTVLERLGARRPDMPHYQHDLAVCLGYLGDLLRHDGRAEEAAQACRQAVAWAQQAVERTPKDGECCSALGVAQYRAGAWQEALEPLHKARELRGSRSEDGFYLALAHGKLGEKDLARQWYDRACVALAKDQHPDKRLLRLRAEAAAVLGLPQR
jgi:serine/threonine protein kinase/Flp pilus assembly protein TadD